MVHGLAGSAAIMLLILTTVESTMQGLLYILVFGIGSTLGMLMVSGLIGLPFVFSNKFVKVQAGLKWTAGLTSMILGLTLMYDVTLAY